MFDFAEHLIEQQRAFAKQMLKAASKGQAMVASAGNGTTTGSPLSTPPAVGKSHLRRPDSRDAPSGGSGAALS